MLFSKKPKEDHAKQGLDAVSFTPGTIVREGAAGKAVIPPQGGTGNVIEADPTSYWIRLVAGAAGGFYTYVRCHRDPASGLWVDESQHGTVGQTGVLTPAHEVNDEIGLPAKKYRAWPTPGTFAIEFQAEECDD